MDDKDKPFLNRVQSNNKLYFAEIGDKVFKELPIVEDSVMCECDEMSVRDMAQPKSYSFRATVEDVEAWKKLAFMHPDVQKIMQHAQNMLDHIKEQLDLFYRLKQPLNRKERRERARELKGKIQRFNAYCKEHGIEIKNNPE